MMMGKILHIRGCLFRHEDLVYRSFLGKYLIHYKKCAKCIFSCHPVKRISVLGTGYLYFKVMSCDENAFLPIGRKPSYVLCLF